ncbi:hypothetical protein GF314_00380 [bacterium]|nr:hypothetical protein [bacterium]
MPRPMIAAIAAIAALALLAGCGGETPETTVTARRLVTVTVTEGIDLPGQTVPTRTDTTTLWLGPGLARRDAHGGSYIVDTHRDLLTMIDHRDRTYTRNTTAAVAGQLAALARDTTGTGSRQQRQLQSLLDVGARVTDTGETGTIDGYPVRRWIVEQQFGRQRTTSELWLTTAIDVDYALLHRATRPALAALPGGEDAVAELRKLRGVPVRSSAVIEVMGRQTPSRSRLVTADLDTVPLSFFAPPEGYTETDQLSQ